MNQLTLHKKSHQLIQEKQKSLLKKQLQYLKANSPYYKSLFEKHNINIELINELEDLIKIPVTTKDDLQQNNDAFVCVDKDKIAEYVTTSGTMGKPVTFALTKNDLERLGQNEANSLAMAGCTSKDIIQLACTMDKRFMAGLAYYLGTQKLGAGTIRVGAGVPELQWDSILRFSPTVIVTVPSFLLKMVTYAQTKGIAYNASSVKKVVCIGEPIRQSDFSLNTLGKKLKDLWDIEYYSTYASTEMSTAFTECEMQIGGHEIPDLIIAELLDENDMPVAEGEPGEVTITTLGVEGMPLLRFKTGDMCLQHTSPCKCGRNTKRLGPIIGRRQHMIKLKGTTIYPETIFNTLNEIDTIENYIVEVASDEVGNDVVLIKLGVTNGFTTKEYFNSEISSRLRVTPQIKLYSPQEIYTWQFPAMSRKPIKFIDNRNSNYEQ